MQRRRQEFVEEVRDIPAARLVFVDETGSNVAMTRLSSRARVGERAYGKAPKNHGVNLTVVGAIALDGVRAMMAYEGGTTREAFLRFVHEALVPSLHKGDVVVMDNLRAHYTDGVQRAIEAVGACVLYLPPYSPELNPIELTWSKLKAILRRIGARCELWPPRCPTAEARFAYRTLPDGSAMPAISLNPMEERCRANVDRVDRISPRALTPMRRCGRRIYPSPARGEGTTFQRRSESCAWSPSPLAGEGQPRRPEGGAAG